MNRRDRSRQGQLQRMLGSVGQVLPYVSRPNGNALAAGWYAQLELGAELDPTFWMLPNGRVYLGSDMPHAGATITLLCRHFATATAVD